MSNLGNPEMEIEARGIFRTSLHLHYIEGLSCGDDVQRFLRTHGGWFRDNQETYDYDVENDPEDIMSTDPSGAMVQARELMPHLYYVYMIIISEAYLQRAVEARNGADITHYGGSTPLETTLASLALEWLVRMDLAPRENSLAFLSVNARAMERRARELAPTNPVDVPTSQQHHSTSTLGVFGTSDGSRSRSRSRSRSPFREMDDFSDQESQGMPLAEGTNVLTHIRQLAVASQRNLH